MFKYLLNNKPEIPTNNFNFKVMYPFKNRIEEATRVLSKHPDKVPIILE